MTVKFPDHLRGLSILVGSVVFALVMTGCREKSSRREVVLYCSADQVVAEPIIAEFERQTGIRVRARFDTEGVKTLGLVQRLRAEAAEPLADVFWSSEIFYTVRLAREHMLAEVRDDAMTAWPARLADPGGQWYGFALRARVICYSTRRVSAEEAPRRLEDLLDPRWKGRLVMANPKFGTTGGDVASWFAHYGTDRAREILTALKANDIRLVDGNSIAVRMVATGQADVCMTDTDDVHAGMRNGWPVAMNPLDQGGRGALIIPNTVAVIRGAPHPREAKELLIFLLSVKVEEMLARSDSHNIPIRPSLAAKFKQYDVPSRLDADYPAVADKMPEALTIADEILR